MSVRLEMRLATFQTNWCRQSVADLNERPCPGANIAGSDNLFASTEPEEKEEEEQRGPQPHCVRADGLAPAEEAAAE